MHKVHNNIDMVSSTGIHPLFWIGIDMIINVCTEESELAIVNLGGTAEIYLRPLYRDGGFFVLKNKDYRSI